MKGLLKFITCGSVDDGKSTLIGHMLYDAKLIFTDQEKALEMDSKLGSRGGSLDYSLLLDGLMAEREQGITIDVAYRYFTTEKRSFIVADTPGHEEYTRNMAVGASFADLAVILIDAAKGVISQTKRHILICNLMGIRHFVFAINKMDIVNYDGQVYYEIMKELHKLFAELETDSMCGIPVSATEGDNITTLSTKMRWYNQTPLLTYLEDIKVTSKAKEGRQSVFIMPVQRVCRPDHTFRGFQGEIEEGCIRVGDKITVLPNGEAALVKSIHHMEKTVEQAQPGSPVTICLNREIDVSRGCVLTRNFPGMVTRLFSAKLLWMDDTKLVPGRSYIIKVGTRTVLGTVMSIKFKVDINNGSRVPVEVIYKNEIADCKISLSEPIVLEKFENNKSLGGFILIDRVTHMTSACGVIQYDLRRSSNLTWQKTEVTKQMRAAQKGQKPLTLWFTGLSGSGKSSLANEIEKRLLVLGKHTMLLDGDNIRMGLNNNLGFTEKDRVENIRRIAEVAKLLNEAGIIVLTAFISPFEQDRQNARMLIGEDFLEIYVSTPLERCIQRDIKGLYKKALTGEISNFTGISSPYEPPCNAEIEINTSNYSLDESADELMKKLNQWL